MEELPSCQLAAPRGQTSAAPKVDAQLLGVQNGEGGQLDLLGPSFARWRFPFLAEEAWLLSKSTCLPVHRKKALCAPAREGGRAWLTLFWDFKSVPIVCSATKRYISMISGVTPPPPFPAPIQAQLLLENKSRRESSYLLHKEDAEMGVGDCCTLKSRSAGARARLGIWIEQSRKACGSDLAGIWTNVIIGKRFKRSKGWNV